MSILNKLFNSDEKVSKIDFVKKVSMMITKRFGIRKIVFIDILMNDVKNGIYEKMTPKEYLEKFTEENDSLINIENIKKQVRESALELHESLSNGKN